MAANVKTVPKGQISANIVSGKESSFSANNGALHWYIKLTKTTC